jgi:hypothetical protein
VIIAIGRGPLTDPAAFHTRVIVRLEAASLEEKISCLEIEQKKNILCLESLRRAV